jgi:signal transduction histidine kinase
MNAKEFIQKIRTSLFLRLILIFMVAGLLLLLTLGHIIGDSFSKHVRSTFMDHISHYSDYIIRDVGTPPDTAKARQITQSINTELAITGREFQWFSSPLPAEVSRLDFKQPHGHDIGIYHDRSLWIARIIKNDYRYYFYHKKMMRRGMPAGKKALFWIIILLFLILCYLAVRHLFKPIAWIKEGTRRIGEGDLDYRLPERRRDELGILSIHINNMAGDIKKMLEAKRQLLLAISHELRSPLTRARVSLEFIKDKKVRDNISEDINEMDGLINALLESEKLTAKHSALDMKDVDVNEWLKGNVEELFPGSAGDLMTSPLQEPLKARMDPLRMRLLLKNLVENALRYTPEPSRPVEASLRLENGFLVLEIKDRGKGMTPEQLEQISEPFYRADASRERKTGGHGLGLYLCRLIAEAHGGRLHIESKPGKGTTVRAILPING